MKLLLSRLLLVLLSGFASLSTLQARDSISVDFFYDNLGSQGTWREVGDYGYCWQPDRVGDDWRPYSDGRWLYTDAGWTWDSDESFGWAVYHYGRWANVSGLGWFWVPGTEWGPGWVSWRHSEQYVGWAPLPPEARFQRNIGLSGWVDDYYDIGPGHYRFVENRNFGARRLNTVFVDQRQNLSIIHQTTNITHITYVNQGVHNGGLLFDQQSRQSREPLQRYRLNRHQDLEGDPRQQSAEQLRSRVQGDSLHVFALPITGSSRAAPRQLGDRVARAQVNHGWKNMGSPEQIANARLRMKSQEKAPEKLPPPTVFEKMPEAPAAEDDRRSRDRPKGPAMTPPRPQGKPETKPGAADQPPGATTPKMRPGQGSPRAAELPPTERKPSPGFKPRQPATDPNIGGRNQPGTGQMPRPEPRQVVPAPAQPSRPPRLPETRPSSPPREAERARPEPRQVAPAPSLPRPRPPQAAPKMMKPKSPEPAKAAPPPTEPKRSRKASPERPGQKAD